MRAYRKEAEIGCFVERGRARSSLATGVGLRAASTVGHSF